jgi:glycosyltransferase involved in cell wall biosynthesis
MPTLSVVVPAYNASSYLGPVLQAILEQSFRPLEVIVVDDGSTDGSAEVIEDFCGRASTFRLLRNERNMGAAFTCHRGLQATVGEYVYVASTSDRVFPGFFGKSMELLTQHPRAALCCSDFVAFYSQGPQFEYKLGWAKHPSFFSPQELAEVIRRKGGYVPGATSITKRSVFMEAGGYIAELRGHADWFGSLVSAFRHGICYMPEALAAFRMMEPGSLSPTHRQWPIQRQVLDHLFVLLGSAEYRDVAPMFKSSAALSCLPLILRALLRDPTRRGYLTTDLVRHALWNELRREVLRMTPMVVKNGFLRLRRLVGMRAPSVHAKLT